VTRPEPKMQLPQANDAGPTPGPEPEPTSNADGAGANRPAGDGAAAGRSPIRDRVYEAIKTVYDPEIPVNIYELGLIYEVHISEESGHVHIVMTLTTPNCPEAQSLPQMVQDAVESVEGVAEASVRITWEPMWNKDMMSDEAKFMLGLI